MLSITDLHPAASPASKARGADGVAPTPPLVLRLSCDIAAQLLRQHDSDHNNDDDDDHSAAPTPDGSAARSASSASDAPLNIRRTSIASTAEGSRCDAHEATDDAGRRDETPTPLQRLEAAAACAAHGELDDVLSLVVAWSAGGERTDVRAPSTALTTTAATAAAATIIADQVRACLPPLSLRLRDGGNSGKGHDDNNNGGPLTDGQRMEWLAEGASASAVDREDRQHKSVRVGLLRRASATEEGEEGAAAAAADSATITILDGVLCVVGLVVASTEVLAGTTTTTTAGSEESTPQLLAVTLLSAGYVAAAMNTRAGLENLRSARHRQPNLLDLSPADVTTTGFPSSEGRPGGLLGTWSIRAALTSRQGLAPGGVAPSDDDSAAVVAGSDVHERLRIELAVGTRCRSLPQSSAASTDDKSRSPGGGRPWLRRSDRGYVTSSTDLFVSFPATPVVSSTALLRRARGDAPPGPTLRFGNASAPQPTSVPPHSASFHKTPAEHLLRAVRFKPRPAVATRHGDSSDDDDSNDDGDGNDHRKHTGGEGDTKASGLKKSKKDKGAASGVFIDRDALHHRLLSAGDARLIIEPHTLDCYNEPPPKPAKATSAAATSNAAVQRCRAWFRVRFHPSAIAGLLLGDDDDDDSDGDDLVDPDDDDGDRHSLHGSSASRRKHTSPAAVAKNSSKSLRDVSMRPTVLSVPTSEVAWLVGMEDPAPPVPAAVRSPTTTFEDAVNAMPASAVTPLSQSQPTSPLRGVLKSPRGATATTPPRVSPQQQQGTPRSPVAVGGGSGVYASPPVSSSDVLTAHGKWASLLGAPTHGVSGVPTRARIAVVPIDIDEDGATDGVDGDGESPLHANDARPLNFSNDGTVALGLEDSPAWVVVEFSAVLALGTRPGRDAHERHRPHPSLPDPFAVRLCLVEDDDRARHRAMLVGAELPLNEVASAEVVGASAAPKHPRDVKSVRQRADDAEFARGKRVLDRVSVGAAGESAPQPEVRGSTEPSFGADESSTRRRNAAAASSVSASPCPLTRAPPYASLMSPGADASYTSPGRRRWRRTPSKPRRVHDDAEAEGGGSEGWTVPTFGYAHAEDTMYACGDEACVYVAAALPPLSMEPTAPVTATSDYEGLELVLWQSGRPLGRIQPLRLTSGTLHQLGYDAARLGKAFAVIPGFTRVVGADGGDDGNEAAAAERILRGALHYAGLASYTAAVQSHCHGRSLSQGAAAAAAAGAPSINERSTARLSPGITAVLVLDPATHEPTVVRIAVSSTTAAAVCDVSLAPFHSRRTVDDSGRDDDATRQGRNDEDRLAALEARRQHSSPARWSQRHQGASHNPEHGARSGEDGGGGSHGTLSPNRYVDPVCGPRMLGVSAHTIEAYNARLGLLTPSAADALSTRGHLEGKGAPHDDEDATATTTTLATPCCDHDPYLWHCGCCDEATSFKFCHQCGRKGVASLAPSR